MTKDAILPSNSSKTQVAESGLRPLSLGWTGMTPNSRFLRRAILKRPGRKQFAMECGAPSALTRLRHHLPHRDANDHDAQAEHEDGLRLVRVVAEGGRVAEEEHRHDVDQQRDEDTADDRDQVQD